MALTSAETPMHNHMLNEYEPSDAAVQKAMPTATSAIGIVGGAGFNLYAPLGTAVTMDPNAIGQSGAGNPHENRQPYLGLNYSVALVGNYPQFN